MTNWTSDRFIEHRDKKDQRYYLTARRHHRQLVDKSNRLFSDNFTIRILWYKNVIDLCISCVVRTVNKDDVDDDDDDDDDD